MSACVAAFPSQSVPQGLRPKKNCWMQRSKTLGALGPEALVSGPRPQKGKRNSSLKRQSELYLERKRATGKERVARDLCLSPEQEKKKKSENALRNP